MKRTLNVKPLKLKLRALCVKTFFSLTVLLIPGSLFAQTVSKVWVADNGDGTYKNPVINADYSDPDAIRVGNDYYLIASSFEYMPGLPILHSKDLVNWTLIGHALQKEISPGRFAIPLHGEGVWAPSIRYHKNEFYIYYPDPDYGIYLIKAKNILGPWTEPVLVMRGQGLIDPCPLWDDDGKLYLIHAFAGSRAGIKSVLAVNQLNAEGDKTTDHGIIVYDGHEKDPTIEGPKFYKRNGFYYIFAPAGGVPTGWQLVLRSKNIYGPYERKVVMDQGLSSTNGPHQGAWVTTQTGEDWFLHFQDKGAYGRVLHLQPMKWLNDWPVIGVDKDGDGKGEPVLTYKKPNVGRTYPISAPVESDEFNTKQLGLQWQWSQDPGSFLPYWWFFTDSALRLYSYQLAEGQRNFWKSSSILSQKFPADAFMATAKFSFSPHIDGEKAGLIVFGMDYAYLALVKKEDVIFLQYSACKQADKDSSETQQLLDQFKGNQVYLRVTVTPGANCQFSYSLDNQKYTLINQQFLAQPGRWVGAKLGIFCSRTTKTNDSGYADFDWFRIENN